MDLGLAGRVAVVTAASKGLGRAPALGLAAEGAKVVLDAVNANLLASVRLARAAVPHMRAQQWGRIVFVASASVKQPIPDLALSDVGRTGLWAWTKTAAQDLASTGITVNLAAPGPHATDRLVERGVTGRTGDPADFGQVVAFLCSQQAALVNGTALAVDGGAVVGLL